MKRLAVGLIVGGVATACAQEAAWDGPTSEGAGARDVEAVSSEKDASVPQSDARSADAASDAALDLSSPPAIPESWVRVTGDYGISLAAPAPGLRAKPPQCGTDSCSVPFEGGECSYSADRNSFVDQLQHYEAPTYIVKDVRVDGMAARFIESVQPEVDGNYVLAICLYVPHGGARAELDLGVAGAYARCPTADSAAVARIVLQSLALAPLP
jgi:hypothetical protein